MTLVYRKLDKPSKGFFSKMIYVIAKLRCELKYIKHHVLSVVCPVKSVSPVKPCKVVQKQGSPICMKFCEQVTLYPSIVNLKKKFWLVQYGRHIKRHLSLIVFSWFLHVFLEKYSYFQLNFFQLIVLLNYETKHVWKD